MVVLLAVEYLHVLSGDLHSSDMAGLLLPLLPEPGPLGVPEAAGKGETASTAAGTTPWPAQTQEPDGRELRHRSQGLGGGAHLGPDHNRQNPGEYTQIFFKLDKEARGCFDSSWAMDLELSGMPLDGSA